MLSLCVHGRETIHTGTRKPTNGDTFKEEFFLSHQLKVFTSEKRKGKEKTYKKKEKQNIRNPNLYMKIFFIQSDVTLIFIVTNWFCIENLVRALGKQGPTCFFLLWPN